MPQTQTQKLRHDSGHDIRNWREKRRRQQKVIASSVRMRNRRNSTAAAAFLNQGANADDHKFHIVRKGLDIMLLVGFDNARMFDGVLKYVFERAL
jgi:hypothetical protein